MDRWVHVRVFVTESEWEGGRERKTRDQNVGWEGSGDGTKEGGERMTRRGLNDGDDEWEARTVTR